jgi:hypothetical protein
MLFVRHGAPLVLKADNGSAFIAEATRDFLSLVGVNLLFSPPHTPRYNGSIEAGIGSLKTRTERHACRASRPLDVQRCSRCRVRSQRHRQAPRRDWPNAQRNVTNSAKRKTCRARRNGACNVKQSAALSWSTAFFCTRGGEFLYRLRTKKRQTLCRGHTRTN